MYVYIYIYIYIYVRLELPPVVRLRRLGHTQGVIASLRGPRSTVRMVLLRTSAIIGYYRIE